MTQHTPDDEDAVAIERLIAAATAYQLGWAGDQREAALKALTTAAMRLPDPREYLIRCPGTRDDRSANRPTATWYAIRGPDGLHHPLEPHRWGWACECPGRPRQLRGRGAPQDRTHGCEGPALPSETVPPSTRCTPGHWYWPIYLAIPAAHSGKPIPETWARSERPPAWWVRVQLWNRQGGLCAVCRERPGQVIDHDHDTGLARGLLCRSCNVQEGQCARGDVLCPADRAAPCFPEYWQDPPARWLGWTHDRHSTTLARKLEDVCGRRCPAVLEGRGPGQRA